MQIGEILKDKYILCLCEGSAELDIMNMLLEDDLLIFDKEDLIDGKFHKRESVLAVQDKFLGFSYKKNLVILRVIDSKREGFKLGKAYEGRFQVVPVITNPEIEILIVIDRDDYEEYCKEKSKVKPSSFCKRKYGYSSIKHKGFMRKCFKNTVQLSEAIRKHKKIIGRSYLTIADLLK